MKGAKVLLASAVACMMLAGSALAVFGYEGQVPAQIVLTGTCRGNQVIATVRDSNGAPVSDVQVDFSFVQKGDDGDSLSPSSDMTNTAGKATAGLALVDVPGTRVIQALIGGSSAEGGLTLSCTHGLPPTTADSPAATDSSLPLIVLLAAAALVLGGALTWRTVRVRA